MSKLKSQGPEEPYKTHKNNKSSFGGNFENGSIMKLKQPLQENSVVTFQYYNSSKFASNSTNKDLKTVPQNCFYMTEYNSQNYDSKESSKMSAGNFPPSQMLVGQHKKVADLINLGEDTSDYDTNGHLSLPD